MRKDCALITAWTRESASQADAFAIKVSMVLPVSIKTVLITVRITENAIKANATVILDG